MSVRDLRQTARVVADQVEVASYVGRTPVALYRLPVSDWVALESQHANPAWWKRELVRGLTDDLDDQPGGPEQADRIRDAQVAAIDKALGATVVKTVLPAQGLNLVAYLDMLERSLVQQALDRTDGNKAQAARLLGLNRTTLVEMVKRQGAEK